MKQLDSSTWVLLAGLSAIVVACAAKPTGGPFGNGGNGNGSGGTTTSTSGGIGGAGGEGGGFIPAGAGGMMDAGMACNPGLPDKDNDGDGYTENENDCDDCDPNVNPGAVEVITPEDADAGPDAGSSKPADENCNGKFDEPPTPCDTGLTLNSEEPLDATKAIGMCEFVKSAKWVLADGSPPPVDATKLGKFHMGHGILPKFGTNNKPQEGASMLMLSSGTARDKGNAESVYRTFDKNYTSNAPFGFPKASSACPGVTTGLPHDATGVQIEVNAPTNAQSASFDFQFFTYEWAFFVCQQYNDFFVAHVEPFPMGQMDGNVAFDGNKNPISVNNAFINACGCPGNPPGTCDSPSSPGVPSLAFTCTLGKTFLAGTPFENDLANPGWTHGSTGWLRTTMPVTPGSTFRIRLVTYDSSDGNLDSSTLIDNWQWYGTPGAPQTEVIVPK